MIIAATLLLAPHAHGLDDPTIARLTFQVDPGRMDELAAAYDSEIVPHIERLGWKPAAEESRPTADGHLCRLFLFDSLSHVGAAATALEQDDDWAALCEQLGLRLDTEQRPTLRHWLAPYRAPLEVVRRVPDPPEVRTPTTLQGGHWKSFDETDGLSAISVWRIVQSRSGELWVATYKGLSRYDGQSWTMYTVEDGLPTNNLQAVFEDRDGSLWIGGAEGGLCRFDRAPDVDDRCQRRWSREDGLTGDQVSAIVQDRDGFLWIGTDRGASRVQPSAPLPSTLELTGHEWPPGYTYDGHVDRQGTVWFGRTDGLYRFDGRRFVRYTTEDGLPSDQVRSVFQDRDGQLWIGTGAGAATYDGHRFHEVVTTLLQGQSVRDITQDAAGNLWFATADSGAIRFDGSAYEAFDTEDGLAAGNVRTIIPDREGNLWIGLFGGITRYTPQGFTRLHLTPGSDGDSLRVGGVSSPADGRLRLGIDTSSVSIFESAELVTRDLTGVLDGDRVWPSPPSAAAWIGGRNSSEIAHLEDDQWSVYRVSHLPADTQPLWRDQEGALWLRSHRSLARLDDGVTRWGPGSMAQRTDGKVWIASWQGVSVHDPETEGVFAQPVPEVGIAEVHAIIRDSGDNLWVIGLGGLSRYDGTSWRRFTTRDGVAGSRVHRIVERRNGQLWFTTTAGLGLYDGRTFQKMTRDSGLPWHNLSSLAEDEQGHIWIHSDGAVVRYRPPPPAPPTIAVRAVVAERRHTGVDFVELPSTAGVVVFEYGGVSLRPEPLVYRYRLAGLEENWRNTPDRRVEYHDLPTGDYTFEVFAVDQDLVVSAAPATVAVTVHLPYVHVALGMALAIAAALTVWQSARVIRRGRHLRESNQALSDAVHELFDANKALERDKAVAGIRVEVQSMERADDFVPVLSELTRDLAAVGIGFEDCEIDVLDEPVDRPTMAWFEEHGFRTPHTGWIPRATSPPSRTRSRRPSRR